MNSARYSDINMNNLVSDILSGVRLDMNNLVSDMNYLVSDMVSGVTLDINNLVSY